MGEVERLDRRNRRRGLRLLTTGLLAAIFLLTGAGSCLALGDDLFVSGFVSQGYLKTTDNNYLVSSEDDGSAEYNEMALTMYSMPMPKLRIGVQFFARDLGMEGNNDMVLDWAYGDYRWRDYLGFRAGKIKLPMGLYNKIRDIDVVKNTVLLPQSVYAEGTRDFTLAHEGVSIYGNVSAGPAGDFDYEAYAGNPNVPSATTTFWNDTFRTYGLGIVQMINATLQAQYPVAGVGAAYVDVNGDRIETDGVYGGQLIWNTPLDGLRAGGTFITTTFTSYFDLTYDATVPNPSNPTQTVTVTNTDLVEAAIDMKSHLVFSGEYTWNKLRVAGEYLRANFDVTFTTPDAVVTRERKWEGYYGQVGYQVLDWLRLIGYYSEFYPDVDDKDGAAYNPDYLAWQKDLAITGRIDVNPNWTIKLEFHSMNGAAQVSPAANLDGLDESWMLFAAKSTFHF